MQQCSSNGSGITVWSTNGWTYDGLNRVQTETSKDGAMTTATVTTPWEMSPTVRCRVGLTWSASYLSDGRMASEQEHGGSLTVRSNSYTYYPSNRSNRRIC